MAGRVATALRVTAALSEHAVLDAVGQEHQQQGGGTSIWSPGEPAAGLTHARR